MSRTYFLSLLALVAGVATAPRAAAQQGTDPVTAEVLFQEARALLQAGKLDQACPKFIESQRLDPATGTLLAVATCHEREGKLATAWSEFTKAVGRARQERSDDRVEMAQRRAEDLQPQLSTLTISVPAELARLPGLVVQRDGLEIGDSTWNRALPIDGGQHALRVSAPGYETVALAVSVGVTSDHASVSLPMLQPVRAAALEPAPSDTGAPPPSPARSLTPLRALGLGMGAAGVGGLALGGAFLTGALIKKGDSAEHCDGNACDAKGVSLRSQATDWGTVATIAAVTGSVLTAAGVSLYFFAERDVEGSETGQLALSFGAVPGGAATRLEVEF